MINVGDNNINVYVGDTEVSVYAGDELIYPLNFGTLTAITLTNLTWVKDIPWTGGTGTSANCSYIITGYYDSGKTRKLNSKSTVLGEITASSTTSETRDLVGTLVLTATCSGFSATGSVDAYQEIYKPAPANNEIWYTSTDGNIVTPNNMYPTSNTYVDGKGVMVFGSDLTNIPGNAFYENTKIQTLTLPSSVTYINTYAFRKTSSLTTINLENITGLNSYGVYYMNGLSEMDLSNLIQLPNGNISFCSNLTSVTFSNLSSINFQDNFAYCSNLISITFGATPPAVSGTLRGWDIPRNGTIYCPMASLSTYEAWKANYFNAGSFSTWTVVGI